MNAKTTSTNDTSARLAGAALRGILAEVGAGQIDAGEVLARLLGGQATPGAPAAPPAPAPASPPRPASPAARSRARGRRRPRPAAPSPATSHEPGQPEAAKLAAELVRRAGNAKEAGIRYGLNAASLGRWKKGRAASAKALESLRQALAAEDDRAGRAEAREGPAPASSFRASG